MLIAIYRILMQLYLDKISTGSFNIRKILVVGNEERGKYVTELLNAQLSWGHEIIGTLAPQNGGKSDSCVLAGLDDFTNLIRSHTVDEVVFALEGDRGICLDHYLDICKKMGIPTRMLPSLWKQNGTRVTVEMCQQVPFITIGTSNFNATGLLYKRILDIIGGLVGESLRRKKLALVFKTIPPCQSSR